MSKTKQFFFNVVTGVNEQLKKHHTHLRDIIVSIVYILLIVSMGNFFNTWLGSKRTLKTK